MFGRRLLTTFLLSLSLSVDDLAVGVAYGLQRRSIRLGALLLVILGSAISMVVAMLAGRLLTTGLPHSMADWISAALLAGLGVWTLTRAYRERHEPPEAHPLPAGVWEAFYLGLALGIDDSAEAMGLAIAGYPIALTVVLFKLSQAIAISLGSLLGWRGLGAVVRRRLAYLPGLVLLLVGAAQLW